MFPFGKNIVRNNALTITLREIYRRHSARRLFVEHRTQLGLLDHLFKNSKFSLIKMPPLLLCIEMSQIKWPDTNFRYLERVEHIHGYGIRPLIRQMPAYSVA